MKRAVNLARVSTPQQAKLYSLDFQLEQERAYDAEVGLAVVAEFKDDVSGRRLDRDGLEEACRMLENDQADVLVTWKFDRLHRNYVNSVIIRDRIRKAGKEIHYAQTKQISGKTARQRLPEDLQYILAEIEVDDIADRTMEGKRRKVVLGQKWLGLNKPPYGYTKVGSGHDSSFVIDEWEVLLDDKQADPFLRQIYRGEIPAEVLALLQEGKATAVVIRLIFVWYVFGAEGEGPLSTKYIGERLTALRIPTPGDLVAFHARKKQRGYAEWERGALYRILREDAYNGTFYHDREKVVNGHRQRNPRSEWQGVPVPRIVPENLFILAQDKLNKGIEISSRGTHHEYLVGRRIFCECGYAMRGKKNIAKHERSTGLKRYEYMSYRCPAAQKKVRVHSCTMRNVSVRRVDRRVWEWVREEIANPAILERKLHEIQSEQQNATAGEAAIVESLEQNRQTMEEELKRLASLYAKQAMPERILDELISQENHKLSLIVAEIARMRKELETPLSDETIQTLLLFSMEFAKHLEAVEETFEGRRAVIDGLDTRVQVFWQDEEIWLNITTVLKPEGMSIPLLETDSFPS